MAKSKGASPAAVEDDPYSDWKIDDAVRTLTRAHEIESDPKMMEKVKRRAAEQAAELTEVAGSKVAAMVKRGLISEKQAAKLKSLKAAAD